MPGIGDEIIYDTKAWSVFPHVVWIYNTMCSISRVMGTLLQLIHLLGLWPRVGISIFLLQVWIVCSSSAESSVLGLSNCVVIVQIQNSWINYPAMSVVCSVQLVENVLLFTLLNLLSSYFRYEYSQEYVACMT